MALDNVKRSRRKERIMITDLPSPTRVETDPRRDAARERIQKRRNLQGGFVAYVVINAFLVGVWAFGGGGYFWPAWIIGGWGVAMVLGLWDYLRGPVTEADVDDELRRRHR